MNLIYLASPYSHADPAIKQQRVFAIARVAGDLINQGCLVFSPIAHGETIVLNNPGFGDDWARWQLVSRGMIAKCDEFWVVMIDGWNESNGVRAEIAIAHELGKPVQFLYPKSFELTEYPYLPGKPYRLGNKSPRESSSADQNHDPVVLFDPIDGPITDSQLTQICEDAAT
jgi:hypothetical protein